MNARVIGISRYLDISNVEQDDLLLPDAEQHKRWVEEDGISLFNLPPYSMTQLVILGKKRDFFYVDTGEDGHAVRTFDKAKMVLEQSMKWHQEATLRQLEIVKEQS